MLQDFWDRYHCVQNVFFQVECTKVCWMGEQGGWRCVGGVLWYHNSLQLLAGQVSLLNATSYSNTHIWQSSLCCSCCAYVRIQLICIYSHIYTYLRKQLTPFFIILYLWVVVSVLIYTPPSSPTQGVLFCCKFFCFNICLKLESVTECTLHRGTLLVHLSLAEKFITKCPLLQIMRLVRWMLLYCVGAFQSDQSSVNLCHWTGWVIDG